VESHLFTHVFEFESNISSFLQIIVGIITGCCGDSHFSVLKLKINPFEQTI
jgi:hypothetical protein